MINEKTGEKCSTNFKREISKLRNFSCFTPIMVIKQANSLLQPALKFVRDRNTQYNAI